MSDDTYSPIPEGKSVASMRAQPTKMELNIDMESVMKDIQSDLDSMKDEWREKLDRRFREELYQKILNAGKDVDTITELSVNPDDPLETLGEGIHELGIRRFHGIGIHGDLLKTMRKKYVDGDDEDDEDGEEIGHARVFGIPLVTDPRRSRDQALAFRSKKIWKAYQELLNDSVPTMVQNLFFFIFPLNNRPSLLP